MTTTSIDQLRSLLDAINPADLHQDDLVAMLDMIQAAFKARDGE